jgi:hypothetical protein
MKRTRFKDEQIIACPSSPKRSHEGRSSCRQRKEESRFSYRPQDRRYRSKPLIISAATLEGSGAKCFEM